MALGLGGGDATRGQVLQLVVEHVLPGWVDRFRYALDTPDAVLRVGELVRCSVDLARAEPVLIELLADDLPLRFTAPQSAGNSALLLTFERQVIEAVTSAGLTAQTDGEAAGSLLRGWIGVLKALARGR